MKTRRYAPLLAGMWPLPGICYDPARNPGAGGSDAADADGIDAADENSEAAEHAKATEKLISSESQRVRQQLRRNSLWLRAAQREQSEHPSGTREHIHRDELVEVALTIDDGTAAPHRIIAQAAKQILGERAKKAGSNGPSPLPPEPEVDISDMKDHEVLALDNVAAKIRRGAEILDAASKSGDKFLKRRFLQYQRKLQEQGIRAHLAPMAALRYESGLSDKENARRMRMLADQGRRREFIYYQERLKDEGRAIPLI